MCVIVNATVVGLIPYRRMNYLIVFLAIKIYLFPCFDSIRNVLKLEYDGVLLYMRNIVKSCKKLTIDKQPSRLPTNSPPRSISPGASPLGGVSTGRARYLYSVAFFPRWFTSARRWWERYLLNKNYHYNHHHHHWNHRGLVEMSLEPDKYTVVVCFLLRGIH